MSGAEPSILWYDLETFGSDPAVDPIAQVAWCRTNLALEQVEAPQSMYCQPPWYCLPDAEASLVTGLSPQFCQREGVSQRHFAEQLLAQLARPETTSAGYNAIRFDDEFVRHLLWRELLDPYAREWQNGNRRFDLLDTVRLTYALRPQGIEWPLREDGLPSFRLEQLVLANRLPQPRAHDAISDVEATIALARLLREKQPRLWAWAQRMADKRVVRDLLGASPPQALVHVSGRYSAERACLALVLPLGNHPSQSNKVAVFDLTQDPQQWMAVDDRQLVEQLFAPRAMELTRPAIKFVHIGRCPMLAPASVLRDSDAARIGLDQASCSRHQQFLQRHPALAQRLIEALSSERDWGESEQADPETDLYGGFVSPIDRNRLTAVRAEPGAALPRFDDPRLDELAWRWSSRVTERMDGVDAERWREIVRQRLNDGIRRKPPYQQWRADLAAQIQTHADEPQSSRILGELAAWGEQLAARAGLNPRDDETSTTI